MSATDTVDQGAEFRALHDRRKALQVEVRQLEQEHPAPTPARERERRVRELEARAELANVEKEVAAKFGPPLPLKAGAPIASTADVDRRQAGIPADRARLREARKKATTTEDLARIDAERKRLDDEEVVLANRRRELARTTDAEQMARARAAQAAENDRRYRLYQAADAIFDEILERLDRLDVLRRAAGLEDVVPFDPDTAVSGGRRWVWALEHLDRFRHEVTTRWRPQTMPPVRAWAEENAPAPEPRRPRGIFGRGAR